MCKRDRPYGILQYKDRAFAIDFTADLEADLLDVLDEMREARQEDDPDPGHDDRRRCAACGVPAAWRRRPGWAFGTARAALRHPALPTRPVGGAAASGRAPPGGAALPRAPPPPRV